LRTSWITDKRVLALATGLCLATACQKAPEAPKAVGPDVWAVVDGRDIHRDDVEKAYRSTVDPTAVPAPSPDEVLTAELNVVDELITQDILVTRARAAGIEATDSEVEKAYADRKASTPDAAFQLQLSARGLTADDMKRGLRRDLTTQKLLDRDVTSKVNVSEQEITDFYNQNRAQFNLAEPQYRLAQIVVTPARDPSLHNRKNDDAGTPAEAQKKAQMLLAQLHSGGVDFAALAQDYSEDPQTVAQGGDLGFVPASALARVSPQLRDAVLRMEPGSVSSMSMNGNFTILAMIAKEPAGQRDLSTPTVHDGIRDTLRTRKQDLLRTAYISAARNDAKVVNYLARQIVAQRIGPPPSLAPAK
jgi:peptidyl-prolyl cis-trans isomerase SurA